MAEKTTHHPLKPAQGEGSDGSDGKTPISETLYRNVCVRETSPEKTTSDVAGLQYAKTASNQIVEELVTEGDGRKNNPSRGKEEILSLTHLTIGRKSRKSLPLRAA